MYTNNISLTNPHGTPFALSNEYDNVILFTESIEDCKTAQEAQDVARRMHRYKGKWTIERDTPAYTRLANTDPLGNIHYLILHKA